MAVGMRKAGGMFDTSAGGGRQSLWQPPSGFEASTGKRPYDISGMTNAAGMLQQGNYKPQAYSPYKFGNIGEYGKSSDASIANTYGKAMSAATAPVMAQGKERMRQASQGWGAGQMSGAAGKELAMKNAQATGQQVADIGKTVGSTMAERMLGQEEQARQQEWQQKKDVQTQQAAENFRAAGFSDQQAQFLANEITQRAGALMTSGMNWMGFQRGVNQDLAQMYNQAGFGDMM